LRRQLTQLQQGLNRAAAETIWLLEKDDGSPLCSGSVLKRSNSSKSKDLLGKMVWVDITSILSG
jgi:hypothetical protein